MKFRFFHVDDSGNLHKLAQGSLWEVWMGRKHVKALGSPATGVLRLVSVMLDDDLKNPDIRLCGIRLDGGMVTEETRLQLFVHHDPETRNEETLANLKAHLDTWPPNIGDRLAAALDLPRAALTNSSLGSPLIMAMQMGVTLRGLPTYLRDDPADVDEG